MPERDEKEQGKNLEQLLGDLEFEITQTDQKLGEINKKLRQSQAEVDRLAQRNVSN